MSYVRSCLFPYTRLLGEIISMEQLYSNHFYVFLCTCLNCNSCYGFIYMFILRVSPDSLKVCILLVC